MGGHVEIREVEAEETEVLIRRRCRRWLWYRRVHHSVRAVVHVFLKAGSQGADRTHVHNFSSTDRQHMHWHRLIYLFAISHGRCHPPLDCCTSRNAAEEPFGMLFTCRLMAVRCGAEMVSLAATTSFESPTALGQTAFVHAHAFQLVTCRQLVSID